MTTQINWDNFSVYNQDSRGIRYKFEDLCRHLFFDENVSGNKQFKYLHSNPNNAGLETDPIFDETNKRWIGFQAKFFEHAVAYKEIENSARKTVNYYSNEVDHVFLFSNKPLTDKSLKTTKSILDTAGITLELITDNAILDLVREKYPYLGNYYFGQQTINFEWFKTHSQYMFEELGGRFNQILNVETKASDELSLFVHDQRAAEYLNAKKASLLDAIANLSLRRNAEKGYLKALENAVRNLPDVDVETLYASIEWEQLINNAVQEYAFNFNEELKNLYERRNSQIDFISDRNNEQKDVETTKIKLHDTDFKINELNELLSLVKIVSVSDRERKLLYGSILSVSGEAGTGKTQLLANETYNLINDNRIALLLVAGMFYTSDQLLDQIISNLRLDFSFEALIEVLEVLGEKQNRIVPIFIDAINETWHKELWKSNMRRIIDLIAKWPMVRLIFSYRLEYGSSVLSDSVQNEIKSGNIISLTTTGFGNTTNQAIKEFFDFYDIPFSPLKYFGYEMSNPLFLTLYCKTYSGENASLPDLYERLIQNVNDKVYTMLEKSLKDKGYTSDYNLLSRFVFEYSAFLVSKDKRFITRDELFSLSFWTQYGITASTFIYALIKEDFLHVSCENSIEHYYFAFDQMNDYYFAKAIIETHCNKDSVCNYLKETILDIKDDQLKKLWNVDLFVNACALYAEKYKEECIDIIDVLTDDEDKHYVFARYIDSFQWRNEEYIPGNRLKSYLNKYSILPEELWEMFIGNSVKINHPLNADYLHTFLLSYQLNRRDYLWTTYINIIPNDEENRLVQLVKMYNNGDKLKNMSEKQIELLLTLFGWLLTSSNRWMRDYTSKAMIEILKEHFNLCQILLEKFSDVNDPYVIQRLYGIVFGACCKRTEIDIDIYSALAGYVYETVFNKENVYPDILLRDYARLIIERFLYENKEYDGCIIHNKIVPPYNSDPIPGIEDQHYLEKDYNGAIFSIIHSMKFNGMGMYGDFGRYIFQSALYEFDVDAKAMFNYAVYHILNELGFTEDYFNEHDNHCGGFDRHLTVKTERIGKKYQWITMYNILARVSDHRAMVDRWRDPDGEKIQFEGAWEPYVRDFDPTLNQNFMNYPEAPAFEQFEQFIAAAMEENQNINTSNIETLQNWLMTPGYFLQNIHTNLILNDNNDTEWVALTLYIDTGRNNLDTDKLYIWTWMYAYFVTQEQKEDLLNCHKNGIRVITHETSSHHQTYSVFNREYPWAPSCQAFNESAWIDVPIKTGKKTIRKEKIAVPDLTAFESYLKALEKYIDSTDQLDDETLNSFDEKLKSETIIYKEEVQEIALFTESWGIDRKRY